MEKQNTTDNIPYKNMYTCICAEASRAIDLLDNPQNTAFAKVLLQQALWKAEELYRSQARPYRAVCRRKKGPVSEEAGP